MGRDSSGNTFFDVGNIRVTALPDTWAGKPGIRIQAYKGQGDALFQGAELPIEDRAAAYDLIRALGHALEEAGV